MDQAQAPVFRPYPFGVNRARVRTEGANTYVVADVLLGDYPPRMTDHLVRWAKANLLRP